MNSRAGTASFQRKKRGRPAVSPANGTFRLGFNKGFNHGFDKGYSLGFSKGKEEAGAVFEGVSIVIPSFNQARLLGQCLNSIAAHTPEPHEIIVIDNGSRDSTAVLLKQRIGKLRYRICESNLGFAGGVNQGLKMARGRYVLFLNNDTVVTDGWLGNLLGCLHGWPRDCLVGPVTNYISGDQRIEAAYTSLTGMHRFAKSYNRPDPGKWETTDRLTGLCILMRREVLERLGYLDEGFELGNCEDDDYGLRAKLLGLDLVIAKDTFLHHVGSASMKKLGESFERVYARNLEYYAQKWGDIQTLLEEMRTAGGNDGLRAVDLYPTHVVVRGAGPSAYWLEHGVRRPIAGEWPGETVRLAQLEQRRYASGEPLTAAEAEARLATLASTASEYGPIAEGLVVRAPDGVAYQSDRGALRRIAGTGALKGWLLDRRPEYPVDAGMIEKLPRGLPIIAPPVIRADNL